MTTKRGRKRKTEMYFGPEEEAAVIRFLDSRFIKTQNFKKDQPVTIEHNLGNSISKNLSISVFYTIPNENAYGTDAKFIDIDVDITTSNFKNNKVDITTNIDVENATIIIYDIVNRDIIFNEWLNEPISKMIESIIRKYKLYRKGFTFEEQHTDTFSFLMTKVHKFDVSKNKKAYSYFGTITKNYNLGLLIKDEKYIKQNTSYEDIAEKIEEREDLTYVIDGNTFSTSDFLVKISDSIKLELEDGSQTIKKKLSDNERKVGYALLEMLENWETAFGTMDGGAKYNKNSVLETMRNYTNLSTKDIRLAMKRYKELYELLKHRGL